MTEEAKTKLHAYKHHRFSVAGEELMTDDPALVLEMWRAAVEEGLPVQWVSVTVGNASIHSSKELLDYLRRKAKGEAVETPAGVFDDQ